MVKPNTVYAEKGEILTCEKGHEICELRRNVDRHGIVYASDFINFRNGNIAPTPDNYVGQLSCNICGSGYIRANRYGMTNCFVDDEWRL